MIKKKHNFFVILFGDSIIPKYIPFYYRLYLLFHMNWRRLYRSTKRRLLSYFFKQEVIADEKIEASDRVLNLGERKAPLINKAYSNIDEDLKTEEIGDIARKINELKGILREKELRFTTPVASFKPKDSTLKNERIKLWENSWMLANSKVKTQDTVLDIGGVSTIFSFFLAHMGCKVYAIDNDWENHGIIYNARFVSNKMGWDMKIYRRNIAKGLPFEDNFFDKIFCICVLEHLPSFVRRNLMRQINRVLKPGGIAGLTFDYDADRNSPGLDKGIRYSFKNRLVDDIIKSSALEIYGNTQLIDDCPAQAFLGSLFLIKQAI